MKRILVGICAALFGLPLFAATLYPVPLLNPVGSTAGQAVLSTGPTTPPAWGGIPLSTLTGVLPVANGGTGLGGVSAGVLLVGTGTNVLNGISATTAGLILAANGVGVAPSYQTLAALGIAGVAGVTSGSNAAAGSVGEYLTVSTAATSISNGVTTSIGVVGLSAGDWDVECTGLFTPSVALSTVVLGVSTTVNTFSGIGTYQQIGFPSATGIQAVTSPVVRENVTTGTSLYCSGNVAFASGTATLATFIRARRVR